MDRADLLATLTGRDEILGRLLTHLRRQRGAAKPRHLLLYGPRGIGKTTLLLALRYSIEGDPGLRDAFEVVQLSEEERRISNLPSFADRLLELLADARRRAAGAEALDDLRDQAHERPDTALDRLLMAGARMGGKQVVFLIDNFDELAIAAVSRKQRRGGEGASSPPTQLRRLLANSSFLFVGTALRDPATRKRELPPHLLEQFDPPIHIGPLAGAELVRKRAALAGREQELLRPGIASRVAGLDRLTGGNPRLLVYLYERLDMLSSLDIEQVVQRLVDDLTPMYQDVIDRLLNRSQAAVLEALAARGGVGRVKEIAADLFLDEQTVRTFLNDLCALELVVRPGELSLLKEGQERSARRETVFRTFPPLFQIWYEMRHLHREDSLFLVHFLSLLTEEGEARRMAEQIRGFGERGSELLPVLADVVDLLDTSSSDLRRDCIDLVIARGGTLRDAAAELDRRLTAGVVGTSVSLLMLRAEVRQQLGDRPGAEEDLVAAEKIVAYDGPIEQRVKLKVAQSRLAKLAGRPSALKLAQEAGEEADLVVSASAPEIKALAWLAESEARQARGELGKAVELALRADRSLASSNPRLQRSIDLILAPLLLLTGEPGKAAARLQRVREIALQPEDHRGEAWALFWLGRLANSRGEYPRAESVLEESRVICRRIGDRKIEAAVLRELGSMSSLKGDFRASREKHRAALELSGELADVWGVADAHAALADTERLAGRLDEAQAHVLPFLAFSRETGDSSRQAAGLMQLGAIRHLCGDYEAALALVQQALALAKECGNLRQQSAALCDLGAAFFSVGRAEEARHQFENALDICLQTGDRLKMVALLNNLAGVSLESGDAPAANRYAMQSLDLARELAFPWGEASALEGLGVIALAQGDSARALAHLEQAHEIFQRLGTSDPTPSRRVAALLANAELSLAASEPLAAESRFRAALEIGKTTSPDRFLGALVNYLVVPALRRTRASAIPLLAMIEPLKGEPPFMGGAAASLAALRALLVHFQGSSAETAVKDLGTPEIEMFRLVRERVERPDLSEARRLLDKKGPAAARSSVERIAASDPNDFEAAVLLGQILLAEGDSAGAEREADKVLRGQPESREATVLAARIAESRHDYQRAIALLENLTSRSENPEDLQALAGLLRRAGRFADSARALRRMKDLSPPGSTWDLDVELASVFLMAGELERAALALPPDDALAAADPRQVIFADLLRVLLALLTGDGETARRHAAAALRRAATLPPGERVTLAPDFTVRVRETIGPREYRLFSTLMAAVSRRVPAEAFAAEFLDDGEAAEFKRRLAEAGEVALAALKRGDLTSLADLSRLTTHNLGARGALIALGENFAELPPAERGVALDLLLEALHVTPGAEALAALGALGSNFGRLTPGERERALRSFVDLAASAGEPEPREGAIQVLNVLYPHLAPAERDDVRAKLEAIRQELTSPALAEFFRETVPATEATP